jgi:thiaminase
MTPEEEQQLKEYSRAIAKILYKNTVSEQLTSLAKIEEVVRSQMQENVMPEVGVFLSKMSQKKAEDTSEK